MVSKITLLPEQFNLKFKESIYKSDPQVTVIPDMIKERDPNKHSKTYAMNRYHAQFVKELHVRGNVVWMDDKLVIPKDSAIAINNRIHYYHYGKSNLFQATKDIWFPCIYQSIASIA